MVYIRQKLSVSTTILLLLLITFMIHTAHASEVNMREVFSIAIDIHDPQVVYITMPRGLYKSINGGEEWIFQSDALEDYPRPLALDSNNPPIIYSVGATRKLNGIFIKSNDGGESWDFANNGVWIKTSEFYKDDSNFQKCGQIKRSIAIDPQNSSILYVGVKGGVCKSVDGGLSWDLMSKGLNRNLNVDFLVIAQQNTSLIYAGTDRGIYKSIDAGESWTAVRLETEGDSIKDLAIDPKNPEIVYAVIRSSPFSYLYKSMDGGEVWQRLTSPEIGSSYWYMKFIAIASDSSIIYVGTREGVYGSTDQGLSWQAPHLVPVGGHGGVKVVAVDPKNPKTVYIGTSGGMFKSTDGGKTWYAINNGLPEWQ